MRLKHIGLIGFIFVACLAGYLTLRACRVPTTDPASQQDDPVTAMGSVHLLQANVPF
jgi:hypothetical protein